MKPKRNHIERFFNRCKIVGEQPKKKHTKAEKKRKKHYLTIYLLSRLQAIRPINRLLKPAKSN